MKIRTHEEAILEAREARRWYRERSPDAERIFSESYKHARARLARYPRSAPVIHGDFRALQLGDVPYAIIYRIDPLLDIVILAVAHAKREPGYWKRRA